MGPMSKLRKLWFSWPSFLGITVRFGFTKLDRLTVLVIENAEDLSDSYFEQIATLPNLETLGISHGAYADSERASKRAWLTLINNCSSQSLVNLRFRNINTRMDNEVLQAIATKFKDRLLRLDLNACQRITDSGLSWIVFHCVNLIRLDVGENGALEGHGWLDDLVERRSFRYLNFTPRSRSQSVESQCSAGAQLVPERLSCKKADHATAISSDPLFA